MSKKDYVYIARLLSESDIPAARKFASKSKEKSRSTIKKEDILGGPINDVQASSVDTSKMIDDYGAFFFVSDEVDGLRKAVDMLMKQPKDAMTFFNRKAGIENENDTFGGGREKVLFAAIPSERFYKLENDGKYIATGEGEYVDEEDNSYTFDEAVIGMCALKTWKITGVNFEMKPVNSFLGKTGQYSDYFVTKNIRNNYDNDVFVQNGWGKDNSGNENNGM